MLLNTNTTYCNEITEVALKTHNTSNTTDATSETGSAYLPEHLSTPPLL